MSTKKRNWLDPVRWAWEQLHPHVAMPESIRFWRGAPLGRGEE
jgi:hypothetical protein